MAKVLLVEDDNNLREIFEMRLQAEGYQAVSAADGEEGLVVAMKEKPDLIIADVMMPKLSGFEMLETLRDTPEMNDVKVIMMTALGQAEDRARGEKLGVVKYLVKSQVTLEDFVRVVREVLKPDGQTSDPDKAAKSDQAQPANNNQERGKPMQNDNTPNGPAPGPTPPANPMADNAGGADADDQMSTADEQKAVDSQVDQFASSPAPAPDPSTPTDDGASGVPTSDPAAPPTEGPAPQVEEPKPDDSPLPGGPAPTPTA